LTYRVFLVFFGLMNAQLYIMDDQNQAPTGGRDLNSSSIFRAGGRPGLSFAGTLSRSSIHVRRRARRFDRFPPWGIGFSGGPGVSSTERSYPGLPHLPHSPDPPPGDSPSWPGGSAVASRPPGFENSPPWCSWRFQVSTTDSPAGDPGTVAPHGTVPGQGRPTAVPTCRDCAFGQRRRSRWIGRRIRNTSLIES